MDIAAIAITAVVGIPLLLLFMIMLIRRMKNKSRKINTNDKNAVIIKLPSQSGVANDDCNSQQCTKDTTGQSTHNHGDKDVPSQVAKSDSAFRLETNNTLYLPTKVKSLDSILQHHKSMSAPAGDYDIILTSNPSYTVNPEGRTTSEQQYEGIQTDDELNQHDEFGYLRLVGRAALDGAYEEVTNPAGGDYVSIDLNPSYETPQDGQDVKLEDNPSYM